MSVLRASLYKSSLAVMAVDLERLRREASELYQKRNESREARDAYIETQSEVETLEEHIRFAETIGDVA